METEDLLCLWILNIRGRDRPSDQLAVSQEVRENGDERGVRDIADIRECCEEVVKGDKGM